MKWISKIVVLMGLVFLLIGIRYFEESLFYDPLTPFFKLDYLTKAIPQLNTAKLFANIALRYLMNTLLSLAIIWLIFKSMDIVKLAIFLYVLLFVIFSLGFFFLLNYSEIRGFLPLFYVRRFLIQPIFLLVLLPAFYFQKKRY